MGKGTVVSFADFKGNKENKEIVKDDIQENEIQNSSYYFNLNGVLVEFGGAFIRDLLEKREQNLEEILTFVTKEQVANKKYIAEVHEKDSVNYRMLNVMIDTQTKSIVSALNYMDTPEKVNKMFEMDSEHFQIISLVFTVLMSRSYTEFDYYKMEKNHFMKISPSIEHLLENPIYKGLSQQ